MSTVRVRPEELNLDLSLDLVLAQVSCAKLHLVPAEHAGLGSLDLRLVDRSVLAQRDVPVHDEEAKLALVELSDWVESDHFHIGSGLQLLCSDHDPASLSGRESRVFQGPGDDLVARRDDLVQLELISAQKVMLAQVLSLLTLIVRVVHFNLKPVGLFEVVVD